MREKVAHRSSWGCWHPSVFLCVNGVFSRHLSKLAVLLFLLIFPVLALVHVARADTIDYVYDEIGRLVGIVDDNGGSARYVYDALGNVTSIERTSAGAVSILEFTPNSGPIGETVAVSGAGFSAIPGNNNVTINGIAATINSATTTKLVLQVPPGASTGPISVTTPSGTATSDSNFTVTTSTLGAPVN